MAIIFYIFICFFTVQPNQEVIFKTFGKVRKVYKNPGLNFSLCVIGRELIYVSTAL